VIRAERSCCELDEPQPALFDLHVQFEGFSTAISRPTPREIDTVLSFTVISSPRSVFAYDSSA
jgi:hypothetical protein